MGLVEPTTLDALWDKFLSVAQYRGRQEGRGAAGEGSLSRRGRNRPMTEPRTKAGQALLGAITNGVASLFAFDNGPDDPSPIPATIAAIEAEAVAAYRADLRARVEALPTIVEFLPPAVRRSMVLAEIDKEPT
jgi:hypothetical protein